MKIETLHKALPERLAVEVSDTLQYFLRSNADQQMRFIIHLSQQLDINILKKAARLTIYQEPIFSYTYLEENYTAYWQKQDEIDSSLLLDLVETTDVNSEVNKFINLTVSPFVFPLVRLRIIRNRHKDVLCINMNHTPTDGAGLKTFASILSDNYNQLLENPDYLCQTNLNGDRSVKQVTRNFSFFQKFQFTRRGFKSPKNGPSWSFDWGKKGNDDRNQFSTVNIPAATFNKMKAFGKLHNATVNDIVLAAFIRVFVKFGLDNERVSKPIIVPVDLRKYMKPGHITAICSLTGSMIVNAGNEIGSSFTETLQKVTGETCFKKKMHAEMNMLSLLIALSKFMPYAKFKEQVMRSKMAPIPLVTNIGIIKPGEINFNNIPVEYAYVTGVVSHGDYFCMGYSTFNNEMTFSVGFKGNQLQLKKVKDFLNDFKTELENIN